MAGSEFFTAGLRDKVTGPAQKMGRAAMKLERQLASLERASLSKRRIDLGKNRVRAGEERMARSNRRSGMGLIASGSAPGLKRIASALTLITVGAAAAGTAIAVKLGGALIDTADKAGRFKLAFSGMLGSAEKGAAFMDRGIALANKFGLDLGMTFENLQQFMALGFSHKQSEEILKMGADMRFLGANTEKVNRVFLALSQIQSAGKLEGDEIRQLAEAGVPVGKIYQRIGEGMGLTAKGGKSVVDQVKKLKEAGKIPADHALNSIAEVLLMTVNKKKLGEAGEEAANHTAGGLIDRMKVRLETGWFRSVQDAEPALVRGLDAVFKGLGGDSAIGGLPVITNFLNKVGDFLERVGPKIPAIAESFERAFSSTANFKTGSFNDFADRLPDIARSLGIIAGHIANIAGYVGTVISSVEPSGLPRGSAIFGASPDSTIGKILDYKPFAPSERTAGHSNASRGFDSIAEGAAFGIKSKTNLPEQAAKNMAKASQDAFDKELKIRSPSDTMFDSGVMFDQGFANGMLYNEASLFAAHELGSQSVEAAKSGFRRPAMNYAALATAAADNITAERSSGGSSVGDVHVSITVEGGSASAKDVAEKTYETFEDRLGDFLDRALQGTGG